MLRIPNKKLESENMSSNVRRESREESYDVAVIGSGMGGLSAASILARAGKKVLVVERHDRPGGYAHSFQRGWCKFDAAIHLTSGCEEGGLIDGLLRALSVRGECEFIRANPFYTSVFPDLRIDASVGTAKFIEAHASLFPREQKNLENLIALIEKLDDEAQNFPSEPTVFDLARAIRTFPELVKYRNATLGEVMAKFIEDPKLKAVFSSLWPYLGLPPSRLSFLYWSAMLMSFLREGAYYCRGTFQNFVNALVLALQKNGGELMLHTRVERILVKGGSVAGIKLENGEEISAPIVISNADATQTFEEMVGATHLPSSYMKKIHGMKPSLSAFVVFLATDLDLRQMGAKHEMFYYDTWDHDFVYKSMLEGSNPLTVGVNIPTITDPSIAPKGQHLMSIITLLPYNIGASWREEKPRFAERLLQKVESKYSGLKDHTLMMEGASPRTMERYTLNLTGAIYGWEVSPRQVGRGRLPHETPIKGLYLSGHWTQPGGGVYAVVVSGVQTAQSILGYKSFGQLFEELGGKRPDQLVNPMYTEQLAKR